MKQAILTKFLPPTNTKGARVKAWCSAGQIIVPWNHAWGAELNHLNAANRLRDKLGWYVSIRDLFLCGGVTARGEYCFVQVEGDRK